MDPRARTSSREIVGRDGIAASLPAERRDDESPREQPDDEAADCYRDVRHAALMLDRYEADRCAFAVWAMRSGEGSWWLVG
jgi:hypothetical protein